MLQALIIKVVKILDLESFNILKIELLCSVKFSHLYASILFLNKIKKRKIDFSKKFDKEM